jgi:hypothetical protein
LNNIGRAGLAGLTGYGQAAAAQDAKAEEEKRKATMQADVAAMEAALRGMPARTVQPLTPNDDEGNVNPTIDMPAQPGSMTDFYRAALKASSPQFQQLGMQGLMTTSQQEAERQRAQAEQARISRILEATTDPQAAIRAGVPSNIVTDYYNAPNIGKEKGVVVNGQLVNPVSGVAIGGPIAPQVNPTQDLIIPDGKGGFMLNRPLVNAKSIVASAGRSTSNTVNNVITKGQDAFSVELGKLDAKQLDQWRDKAEQARSSLSTAQRLREAEATGAYSGGLADQKLAAANLLNGITGVTPKGLVGSQLYNAEASKLVLDHIKGLGANPSNADREFIEKTVPRLATSKEARQQMVNFIEAAANRTINTHESMDAYARQNSTLGGFKFPSTAPAMPTQDAIAAEIARRRGAK